MATASEPLPRPTGLLRVGPHDARRTGASARPSFVSRHAVPAAAVSLLNVGIIAFGVARGWIGAPSDDLLPVYVVVALIWCFGWAAHVLGAGRAGAFGQALALFAAMSATTSLASAVLATTARPYADPLLAGLDARLFFGLRWIAMIDAIRGYPHLLRCLSFAYSSLNWQPALLLAVLVFGNRPLQAWTFLTAFGVALILSLSLFPFFPALGGYAHFGIGPETVPTVVAQAAWHGPAILADLRSGAITTLDARCLSGVITMPSFHAASALLLGHRYVKLGWLGVPGLVLNAAMLGSAVPVGGHYLVDLLAGGVVAGIAIVAADLIHGQRGALHGGIDTDPAVARGMPLRPVA